jgi:hypothetical protein
MLFSANQGLSFTSMRLNCIQELRIPYSEDGILS